MEATRSRLVAAAEGLELELERARLQVESGPDAGAELVLKDRPVTAGRGEAADLRLTDATVSREHVAFEPSASGWRVRDLASKSGTLLDGVRVEAAPLSPGSRVRIGETELVLKVGRHCVKAPCPEAGGLDGLVGESRAMREVFGLVRRLAPLDLPVLLAGPSGAGKEGLARALHTHGPSPEGPYEVVDCTLLGDTEHMRSELFGHVKGAFTGADKDRTGAFVRASGGTLFLDEVGELPLDLQPQLLRVLEQGEVRPLGGAAPTRVRTRVVCATNRDLLAMAEDGAFREDLYYRLAGLVVEVPPLASRGDDVLLLARHFLPEGVTLGPEAEATLREHPWPGNVRELRFAIQRGAALAEGGVVTPAGLALTRRRDAAHPPRPRTLAELEEEAIREALRACNGNREETAQYLGIGRATLFRRLKKMGIT